MNLKDDLDEFLNEKLGIKEKETNKELEESSNYMNKFFEEKLYKYDIQAKKYINKISEKYNISLYNAYESLWNYNSPIYNPEGEKIWNKGKKYVYLYQALCTPCLCHHCEKHVKVENAALHHPKGYHFDHYNHIFSSAVIVHKKCHKKGVDV